MKFLRLDDYLNFGEDPIKDINFENKIHEYDTYFSNEIEKIIHWTNNYIGDILVRCCGFHKVESMQEKTITTSCINYENELREYINNGWNVTFISPFIIDEDNECLKEYPEEFLVIRRLLKASQFY